MPLPQQRPGQSLKIRNRDLYFSFWPVGRTTRRYGLQYRIFSTNPWPTIRRSISRSCPAAARPSALAFAEQSEAYYSAALSGTAPAAKPVLIYYAFLNLAKALILHEGRLAQLDENSQHGLSERLRPGGRELHDAFLEAYPSTVAPRRRINIFDEFLAVISGNPLPRKTDRPLLKLLPQVLAGHRLWAEAANEPERFLAFQKICFREDRPNRHMWLEFYIFADEIDRLGLSHRELLHRSRLNGTLREVACAQQVEGRRLVCFEQSAPLTYRGRADDIPQLIANVQDRLWQAVTTQPPYRKYYAYPFPLGANEFALPQLLALYAIAFYLSSITRYRPHHFDRISDSDFGPFIEAFLNDQPAQYLYLMASRFARQEITKAAIV